MWNARWIASCLLLFWLGGVQMQIVDSNALQRRKLRGNRAYTRRLDQPPYTFELACKLELDHDELTDHAFAQFVSAFCHDNSPGPACSDYSFRELPLSIKEPFVSNVCPKDPKNLATCLHDLMTSNEQLTFSGDVNELCHTTQKMMNQNMLILDDLPRVKHYYGDEELPPNSVNNMSPKNKSVVFEPDEAKSDAKSVKMPPTKQPTKYKDVVLSYLEEDGIEDDAETPGGSRISDKKAKKQSESTVPTPSEAPRERNEEKTEKGDNDFGKSKKSGKHPLLSTSLPPSWAPEIQETEDENVGVDYQEAGNPGIGNGGSIKQSPKGKNNSKPFPSTVPALSPSPEPAPIASPFSSSKVEDDLELVIPTPAPMMTGTDQPVEILPFDLADNLNRDTDLGINLGKFANESVEEDTFESSDSSVTGLAAGAAVIALFGALTAAKMHRTKKRKRKEFLSLNHPALYDDPSVTSERSYTHSRSGESPARSQTKSSLSSLHYIASDASLLFKTVGAAFGSPTSLQPDVEAQNESRKIPDSGAFACTTKKGEVVYLEDSTEASNPGTLNDDDIISICTKEANGRDVLAHNGTTETIVEVLAAAEDQIMTLTSLEQKSYFVGESLLHENVPSFASSEAGPLAQSSSICDVAMPSAAPYIFPTHMCINVGENTLGLRLDSSQEADNLSRSSSFSFTKAEKRDMEDISQEIENDDKRPWRRLQSSVVDAGRSRSRSRTRSNAEESAIIELDQAEIDSILKPLRSRSQSVESALTDEGFVDGESFLSEEVLKQFRSVDQRLSEGIKEFKDTDNLKHDLTDNDDDSDDDEDVTDDDDVDDDDEEKEEKVGDRSNMMECYSIHKTKFAAEVSDVFEEASYASSCPVLGDVVEDPSFASEQKSAVQTVNIAAQSEILFASKSEILDEQDMDSESSSSDGSSTQDGEIASNVGPRRNNSSEKSLRANSDESSSECKPNVTEAHGEAHQSCGAAAENISGRAEGDIKGDDDACSEDDEQELPDFGSLRSHFAASWYHPLQQHVSTGMRPSTPPRLDSDEDFVGNQPASLLAPELSSDDEEN